VPRGPPGVEAAEARLTQAACIHSPVTQMFYLHAYRWLPDPKSADWAKYVTAVCKSDAVDGWRHGRHNSGVVIPPPRAQAQRLSKFPAAARSMSPSRRSLPRSSSRQQKQTASSNSRLWGGALLSAAPSSIERRIEEQKKPREPGKGSRGQGADLGEGARSGSSRGERDLRQTLHLSRGVRPTLDSFVREVSS
jgi:hypothetical protein